MSSELMDGRKHFAKLLGTWGLYNRTDKVGHTEQKRDTDGGFTHCTLMLRVVWIVDSQIS